MAKEEGPRAFTNTLTELDDGRFQHEISSAQHDVMRTLIAHAENHTTAKGQIRITLDYKVDAHGNVEIRCDLGTKTPKETRAVTRMWATPGGNLSPENPRQQKLPLREIPTAAPEMRDAAAPAAVRGA